MKAKESSIKLLKSKRGRPKKNPDTFNISNSVSDEQMFTPKKRRGRPPKKHDDTIDDSENIEQELEAIEKIKKHTIDDLTKDEKPDKKKYYVDNKRLEELIAQYNKDEIIGDELATALYNIAYRMSFLPNFINYSWKEEMIGDGIVKEFKALKNKKYDSSKGKAFSYFSMIAFNAFCNKIKQENKNTEVLKNYQKEQYDSLLFEQNGNNTTNQYGEDNE
jgi:hypothetical protein